jgi:ankyrin repeat protein
MLKYFFITSLSSFWNRCKSYIGTTMVAQHLFNPLQRYFQYACNNNSLWIATWLLKTGLIDVNKADNEGWIPLQQACANGALEIVDRLLAAEEIDVNKAGNDDWTPLHWACRNDHLEIVNRLLAANGIDVNKTGNDGWTPLHWACRNDHLEIVNRLRAAEGIDVNKAGNDGYTPFKWACVRGKVEVVNRLLKVKGVDVNNAYGAYEGATLFEDSWQKHQPPITALLLRHESVNIASAFPANFLSKFFVHHFANEKLAYLCLACVEKDTAMNSLPFFNSLNRNVHRNARNKPYRAGLLDAAKTGKKAVYSYLHQYLPKALESWIKLTEDKGAALFMLMVCLSDGYLKLPPAPQELQNPQDSQASKTRRFFKIAEALPADAQGVLALRTFGSPKNIVTCARAETAWQHLAPYLEAPALG